MMKRPLTGHINCFSEEVRDTMILVGVSMDIMVVILPDFWNVQGYSWLEAIQTLRSGTFQVEKRKSITEFAEASI